MKTGLVSVIIPAYNQGHYLAYGIQSVLDQTYPAFEILVVDDGSTDNTAEIAQGFSDPRLNYIYQENRGLSAARNTGLRLAQGEYISYLDSDDLFLPQKLELLITALHENPQWGMVAGQAKVIDENGAQTGKVYASPIPEPFENLLLGNPLHVGSVLLRREWHERAGEFDETLHSYEDWDMWLRLARLGCKFGWISQPVSLYRFHTAQMTRIGRQMTQATFSVLDKTYRDQNLPASWQQIKDKAYSKANLRAMAQAYLAEEMEQAKLYMQQAVQLDPALIAGKAEELSKRLSALSESPKNACRVCFLERIYANLPDEVEVLKQRAPQELGSVAYEFALDACNKKEYHIARRYLSKALRYQPAMITNRGVLHTILTSYSHF